MARNNKKGFDKANVTTHLALIVALLISLYVMDAVLDATLPLNCPAASTIVSDNANTVTYNATAASTAVCLYSNSSGVQNRTSMEGFFPTAIKFGDDLLPVLGILGVFFIMRRLIYKL